MGITLKTTLLFLLIFKSSFALAIAGGHTVKKPKNKYEEVMLQQTVKLIFPKINSDRPGECSGFLTSDQQVTTAGHCLNSKEFQESIKRGLAYALVYNRSTGRYERIQIARSRFEVNDTESELAAIDYGILTLRKKAPIKSSLPQAHDCDDDSKIWVAGFGLTEKNVTSKDLKYTVTEPLPGYEPVVMVDSTRRKVFFNNSENGKVCPGDSGGPIYCLKNGVFSVVGIINAIDIFQKEDLSIFLRENSLLKWCLGTDTVIGETLSVPAHQLREWNQNLDQLQKQNPGGTD